MQDCEGPCFRGRGSWGSRGTRGSRLFLVAVHGAKGVGDCVERERCGELDVAWDKDGECPDFGPSAEVLDGGGVEEDELHGGHCHAQCEETEEASTGGTLVVIANQGAF